MNNNPWLAEKACLFESGHCSSLDRELVLSRLTTAIRKTADMRPWLHTRTIPYATLQHNNPPSFYRSARSKPLYGGPVSRLEAHLRSRQLSQVDNLELHSLKFHHMSRLHGVRIDIFHVMRVEDSWLLTVQDDLLPRWIC